MAGTTWNDSNNMGGVLTPCIEAPAALPMLASSGYATDLIGKSHTSPPPGRSADYPSTIIVKGNMMGSGETMDLWEGGGGVTGNIGPEAHDYIVSISMGFYKLKP